MSQFEDPTVVKAYRVGNFELKEVDKLPRLTEEKKKLHREARMAEHGWKQKEVVLVEGDEVCIFSAVIFILFVEGGNFLSRILFKICHERFQKE